MLCPFLNRPNTFWEHECLIFGCQKPIYILKLQGLGLRKILQFTVLTMNHETECAWHFSRILASFPCPFVKTTVNRGAAFLQQTPYKRSLVIFGHCSCVPLIHDSPGASGDSFFPESYVYMYPGSSLFVIWALPDQACGSQRQVLSCGSGQDGEKNNRRTVACINASI